MYVSDPVHTGNAAVKLCLTKLILDIFKKLVLVPLLANPFCSRTLLANGVNTIL